ncbi:MAG: 23S rRNA (adenine(2503)-C(2))-methyltransferase RlmN [Erysipelotrichaceae bacterium]
MSKKSIFNFSKDQLIEEFSIAGYKKFKAKQLFSWLYQKNVFDVNEMSDLSKDFRKYLLENYDFSLLSIERKQLSTDGTLKILFKCADGALIESVVMRHNYGNSICVTSQVGCLMGCSFCASGLLKKERDLSQAELALQLIQMQQEIKERISNVVVMGSGEPFDNYDNVIGFANLINDDNGLAIGARHITISTCGLIKGIEKFKYEKQYNLAISLHSAIDSKRSMLMPINKVHNLSALKQAILNYQSVKNRRVSFEYILLKGINDGSDDVQALAVFLKDIKNAYVNLIPYNSVAEMEYNGVNDFDALKFYDLLKKANVAVTLRTKHGEDIDAACGQLRNKVKNGG